MLDLARYHRQMLLPAIGEAGQARLSQGHVLVVGCGALGSAVIDSLARAGVGRLTIIDRDIVELTNLQRQVLYHEAHVAEATPKAEAARAVVERINSEIIVEAHVDDFNVSNAERYVGDADVIVDGLDNLETRYLLNDLAVRRGRPYVYGGAVGTIGLTFVVLPHPTHREQNMPVGRVTWPEEQATPCLRCVFPDAPPPGTTPTCDTAGVLGPIVTIIAAMQATQTLKLLTGNLADLDRSMRSIDLWSNEIRSFDLTGGRQPDCPCCGLGDFEYLSGRATSRTVSLCGRNAVQIAPVEEGAGEGMRLDELCDRLSAHGRFTCNAHLLKGTFENERGADGQPVELMVFPNGRAIIRGTNEPETARSIYARYVGT